MTLKEYIYHCFVVMGWHQGLFHNAEYKLEKEYYITSNTCYKDHHKTIIFMVDGRFIHGGLADRIKGMVSLYAICLKHHWDFKINFIYPFQLTDYLIPQKHNWLIKPEEIDYNNKNSAPVLLNSYQLPTKFHEAYLIKRMIGKKQLHLYSESPWGENRFSELFNQLFQPSEKLLQDINTNKKNIGKKYISATFRFQQLLGDFKEGNYPILPNEQKQTLIKQCLQKIEELHLQYSEFKILITADSPSFLKLVDELPYTYIIPGTVVHMDYTNNASFITYEKSFLDYFLIANAEKIHLIYNNQMYRSGFAKQASLLYNHPYIEIQF